jgi:hypothetical protein
VHEQNRIEVNSKGMADLRRSSHLAHFYSEHRSNRGYPRGISETGNEGADRAVEFDNAKSARGGVKGGRQWAF